MPNGVVFECHVNNRQMGNGCGGRVILSRHVSNSIRDRHIGPGFESRLGHIFIQTNLYGRYGGLVYRI